MKERVIVSATTLIASLASYMYARHIEKDAVPFVMIGGFVGAFAGEVLANMLSKNSDKPTDGTEQ